MAGFLISSRPVPVYPGFSIILSPYTCIENYLYGTFTPLLRVLCGLTSVCLFFVSFTTTSLQTSILMGVVGISAALVIGFYQKRRASRPNV